MQLFSLIICFAKFTDPIRDVTDIRRISAILIAGSGGMLLRKLMQIKFRKIIIQTFCKRGNHIYGKTKISIIELKKTFVIFVI